MIRRDASLESYIQESRPRFEQTLAEMVELPSVSMDPAHAQDMRRMAALAVQFLKELGADAQIVETKGHPVVSGGWTTGKHHPTVTVYNHLDVQPAQEPEWRQPPFTFRKENGVYHGRGATDDKGPALTALLGARYAVDQGVPINIRFLWELEEEIGSPHFAGALREKVAIPRPDSVVVSDTIWIAKDRPAMPYGLRGLLAVRLSLRTAEVGAHSGLTGGAARNPLAELCELVSACVDARTGRVKIPGFYNDVLPLTKQEIKSFLASGFQVKQFMRDHGFRSLRTTSLADVVRRIWASPTFEVHGLVGPKIAMVGVLSAAAICIRPESFVTAASAIVMAMMASRKSLPVRSFTFGPPVFAISAAIVFSFGPPRIQISAPPETSWRARSA